MVSRRKLYVLLGALSMVIVSAVAAGAVGVADPTTPFADEFDGSTDLGNYLLDRYKPGLGYIPTLTEGTFDGRSVGIFRVDGNGPVAGDSDNWYRWEGFKRTTDGTNTGYYGNGLGTCLATTFRLDDDFATNDRMVSFWATTNNAPTSSRSWPIAGIRGYADATPDELWFWVSEDTTTLAAGWSVSAVPVGWDPAAWHTFTYVLTPYANVWYLDGEFLWSDSAAYITDQSTIEYQIFNNENFGADYDVYVDEYRAGSCTADVAETVRPGAMGGWTAFDSNTAAGGATTAYGGSIGTAAWALDTGTGTGPGLGGKSWLFTDDLTGLRLAEITELSYSTYVDSSSTAATHLVPALNIQVDLDGDGLRDTTLVWEAVYTAQGPVVKDTWQKWDALDDGWWHTAGFGTLVASPGAYGPLGYYIDQYPDATIVSWGATPGTAVVTGQSSGGIWAGFVGAVDGFTYAVANGDRTTVNFEAEAPPVNTELPSTDGINGVDKILTADAGTWTGAAPIAYTYQWQRCDDSGGSCSDMVGEIGTTYTTDYDDVTSTFRIEVTGTNVAGAATVTSAAFGPIYPLETVALVDPVTGIWHYYDSAGTEIESFYYGNPGDIPFVGDWDGDGVETPGLYRPSDGFVYVRNSNTQGIADIEFFFGNPGDVPIAGDFNGDGFHTVSVYRVSTGQVFIINELGEDGGGLGPADFDYYFGNPADKPFTGDYTGDGIDTIGLHRESTGLVYFRNDHTQGIAHHEFLFGWPGDRLAAGDWTRSGISTPAVFRPSDTTMYFRHTNTQGIADFEYIAGESDWRPVAGHFGELSR